MGEPAETPVDDRCPFEVAMAVVQTIAASDAELSDTDAVVRAIVATEGQASAGYLAAIQRSGHSVFYQQLLRLFAWGRSRASDADRDRFCFRCGQTFTGNLFEETLHPLLRVALIQPAGFASEVEAMVRSYVRRYTGDRYTLEAERAPGRLRLRVAWARPDAMRAYLESFGLDPAQCLRDSTSFIAGAVEVFATRIVEGAAGGSVAWSVDDRACVIDLPLPAGGGFAYGTLVRTLVRYVEQVEAVQRRATEEERLESDLIASSPSMRRTWELMRRASRSDEIVLLRGELGTGKSMLARKIHAMSRRRDGPLVEVAMTSDVGSDNMVQSDLFGHERGAFTGAAEQKQGLFSLADGGTIFLDEIGDATPEMQAKLLRVIETSTFKRLGGVRDLRVDVRVIAATNRDLERLVEEGRFRADLYYRLCVIPIRLPPLRERAGDVPALAEFLLARTRDRGLLQRRLAPGMAERLASYAWPGNVRELDHALKYAAAMADGDQIGPDDFPDALRAALADPEPPAPGRAAPHGDAPIVDAAALRRALRSGPPPSGGRGATHHDDVRHVDHAKKVWLATLIDEFGGDLALAARYWDRSSEKTLRSLVRAYGLAERLALARARGPRATG